MGAKQRRRRKPFVCRVCSKRFHEAWELAQHARISKHYSHRKAAKAKSAKPAVQVEGISDGKKAELHISFATGYISQFLTSLSSRSGVPYRTLAIGVGEILRHEEMR